MEGLVNMSTPDSDNPNKNEEVSNNDDKTDNKYNIPDDFIYDDHDYSGLLD